MKSCLVLLGLFFSILNVQPVSAAGEIVTFSGNIKRINVTAGTILLGEVQVFQLPDSAFVTVNGKRGRIFDLANGMVVRGSAEVAPSETRNEPRKKIIRMLTASIDPSRPQSRTAQPQLEATPAPSPKTLPDRNSAVPEEVEGLRRRMAGTFWAVTTITNRGETPGDQWISLNGNGTTSSSESSLTGTWKVVSAWPAVVKCSGRESSDVFQVSFNSGLTEGTNDTSGPRRPSLGGGPPSLHPPQSWKLIETPSAKMLSQIPTSPASETNRPTPTASPEAQQAASAAVKANHNNLVFITGKDGAGSGFIASLNGANYLVTNAHVAAGINDADFKTLNGAVVPRGAAAMAVGHDIFRIALPAGGAPLEIMKGLEDHAGIGDDVVVLGNAEGLGVVNTIMGRIVGIGPNLVEINAQFVPGNSGSPIVHLKTGQVIGVATYILTQKYDAVTKDKMPAPIVRRFGYRLDSVKEWQPIDWRAFYAQASIMEKVHTLTESLDDFFRDLRENHSHVTIARHTNPVIKIRIAQWQEAKGRRASAADRESADANFISFLKIACQNDLTDTQRFLTYDYFRRNLAEEAKTRNEMAKAFSEIIRSIRE